tara:strand:- start:85 stop:546 length:462 start_codon:yes stop_codon:yes gene_type:complete
MIDLVYFTPEIRCHRDGSVERIDKRFKKPTWRLVPNTSNCSDGYNQIGVDGKMVKRHRMIAYCFHGLDIDDKTEQVDHISRDRVENTADNLRVVTQQQNQFNQGAKGYCWDKARGKWQAKIGINGRRIHLGYFDNEEDAHQAYLTAKNIYHII